MKQVLLLHIIVLLWGCLHGQALKDTVFLNNGSLIIGEIKKIKLGVITFDPDDANDVTIQLRKLKAISGVRAVFRIETTGHVVYYGRILPHNLDKYARVLTGYDTSVLFIEHISNLYPYKTSFLRRFSGNVGLGYSYTKSSGFGRLNFDGKVSYRARMDEISFSTSGIYTLTDTSTTRDREDVSFKYNHYFTPAWFGTLFTVYQRNLELGLERRYQEGIGVGNKFLTSKDVYAWGRTGMVLNQEKSTENETSGTLAEVYGQVEFNLFRFAKPEINLLLTQAFYYSLSQAGRFRNDGETNLKWTIFKDFNLNLTFYNNYDSKPPVEGSRKFDFSIVFGFDYKF